MTGLEPVRVSPHPLKGCAFGQNSATLALVDLSTTYHQQTPLSWYLISTPIRWPKSFTVSIKAPRSRTMT